MSPLCRRSLRPFLALWLVIAFVDQGFSQSQPNRQADLRVFIPVDISLSLDSSALTRDSDGTISPLVVSVESLKDFNAGSSDELADFRVEAATIPAGARRVGTKMPWPLLYSVPDFYRFRLSLLLETQEIGPAVQHLTPGAPFWQPLAWILGLMVVVIGVWFFLFRNARWDASLEPEWFPLPDVEGRNERRVLRADRNYWRLTWKEGLRAAAKIAIHNTSDHFNYNPLVVRVRLDSIHKDPGLEAARLWLEVVRENTKYGPGQEVLLGPLKAGQLIHFFLWVDLADVPEPQPGPGRRMDFRMAFTDKKEGLLTINDGIVVEENPGTSWLGIDPGTTGSCIASGYDPETLELIPVKGDVGPEKSHIVRSFIYICRDSEEARREQALPYEGGIQFLCGSKAEPYEQEHSERCFYSPKRLIGYNEKRHLLYDGRPVELRGKDAVSMLVTNLVGCAETHLKRRKPGLKPPNKIVVAVPNMFTPAKIEEMKECCRVQSIRQVEHIYEAEATLMYYLWKTAELTGDRSPSIRDLRKRKGEHVLILDFGGASINLAYASVREKGERERKTRVQVLQRIGYALGGDRIDWQIGKILWDRVRESSSMAGIAAGLLDDPRKLALGTQRDQWIKMRSDYRDLCEKTKIRASEMWTVHPSIRWDVLATATNWRDVKLELSCEELIERPEIKFIYNILLDAFIDLYELSLSQGEWHGVDTILYSGRSVQFPHVREQATQVVLRLPSCEQVAEVDLKEAAKTCVALGAAFWGMQQSNIELIRTRSFAHYGVLRFQSLEERSKEFIPLIRRGQNFSDNGTCSGRVENESFPYNAGKLRFYQVMGSILERALTGNDEHHKMSILCEMDLLSSRQHPVTELEIEISQQDMFRAYARCAGEIVSASGRFTIHDLMDDQDESAFWLLFPPKC